VYDALSRRFGTDAVFMDVAAIPFAVSFPEYIRNAVAGSRVLVALIGNDWALKICQPDDPVRMEVECAISNRVPVLPALIGTAAMPPPEALPPSLASVASQNAMTLGTLRDFDVHAQLLVAKIEAILAAGATKLEVTADPQVIRESCDMIVRVLRDAFPRDLIHSPVEFLVVGTAQFDYPKGNPTVTLYVHRVVRLAEVLELHFILSFWTAHSSMEHVLAGWVLHHLDENPTIRFDSAGIVGPLRSCVLKVRRSDEDARQVWRLITDASLRLSLSYVATVSAGAMP
jgi:hypothetical protein